MKNNAYLIIAAVFLGIMNFFLSGAVFLFLIFGIIAYLIYKNSPIEDRKFILTVLVSGFLLRVFLAVILHAITYLKGFHCISGDDLLYTVRAWALVSEWEGKPISWVYDLATTSATGVNPFTITLAAFYKLFGFHPVTGKIINCIIGTLIGWVSYLMGKEIFNRKVARISMLIVTFYPSLVRWSVANLKDSVHIIIFMICVYLLINFLQKKIVLWKIILLGLLMIPLYFFTHMLFFIMICLGIAIVILSKLLGYLHNKKLKIFIVLAIIFFLLAGIYYFFYINPKILVKFLYTCETKQTVIYKSDYAGYYLYSRDFMEDLNAGKVSILKFLDLQFRSASYFMLSPFPWQMSSKSRLMSMPQMFLWYIILLFSIFGFAALAAEKLRTAFLLAALLVFGIVIYSIAEGNIGSAFRHRDIFAPFFIILASYMVSNLIENRKILK